MQPLGNLPIPEGLDRDLDPQLLWRGKDDRSPLAWQAPPLYVQELLDPKALIEEFLRPVRPDLAADELFGPADDVYGPSDENSKGIQLGFYPHAGNEPNRLILGDSLHVMASLAEREGLRGAIGCIYFDPPYGIQFNSNFQGSTRQRDVADGKTEQVTREPEPIKAFRDTWQDGIHSYLTYLGDRLTTARDLLADSGSIFVQIGQENAHLVRCLLDEVFGAQNFVADIVFRKKTMPLGARYLDCMIDHLLWYAKDIDRLKYRQLYVPQNVQGDFHWKWAQGPQGPFQLSPDQNRDHRLLPAGSRVFRVVSMKAPGYSAANDYEVEVDGHRFAPPKGGSWITGPEGMDRLKAADRLFVEGRTLTYKLFLDDFPLAKLTSLWPDTVGAFGKRYVVQTNEEVVKRCLLMATDPGDLVLDPTCGSGTTAVVAERWGRRWIAIDTSRVALALARTRLMGARHPWYRLADPQGDIRQGFLHERVPRITLKSIVGDSPPDEISLCDRPRQDRKTIRVTGRFTVEGLSPHQVVPIDWGDALPEEAAVAPREFPHFVSLMLEHLAKAGIQQADRKDRIGFDSLSPWPGSLICAEGRYTEGDGGTGRRAGIVIGPQFGSVGRSELVAAAHEAVDAGFDLLIACAFSFDAQAADVLEVGSMRVIRARMNADLHMAQDLKNTGKGNLFVVFGEPDVEILAAPRDQIQVRVRGVDVFDPATGQVRSDGPDGIACWFVDTDHDPRCFVVRHAYFLGADDPYSALKTALKADVDPEAWTALNCDTSRPFNRPGCGRIAVKVINHLGDEVLRVIAV